MRTAILMLASAASLSVGSNAFALGSIGTLPEHFHRVRAAQIEHACKTEAMSANRHALRAQIFKDCAQKRVNEIKGGFSYERREGYRLSLAGL